MPSNRVARGLCAVQAHVVVGLVDHQLLHHQLALGHTGDAVGEGLHPRVQLRRRHRLQHQSQALGLPAVDQVTGEQHALGTFRTQPVDPHPGGGAAPDPGRRVADARVLGHHHQIAAQGDVRAAGHGVAVDLADHRRVAAPQRHEVVGVGPHHPVVDRRVPRHILVPRVLALGVGLEVVAGAEGVPGAGEHDHVHTAVAVRPLHRRPELRGHAVVDGVEPLGPVQRDPGDAAVGLVTQRLIRHGSALLLL